MRYFDDGDLTEGLAIASKPYPFEFLLGYWHAVSTSYAGERTTVDYDDPESPALFRVELEVIDGAIPGEAKGPRGRKRPRDAEARSHDDLQVTLNYREWNLEFTGKWSVDEPATVLHLSSNDSPDVGDVDNEATLAFGSVLDDRGYPFLRIMLSACEASSGSDDMVSVEIVAKKTDTTEVHKLELSKNERLRLGYAVRSDGQFEDLVGSGEPKDSYEELARKLGEHSAESARIAQQMQRKRLALDDQLREAVDAGRRVKSIYNEQRLSLPSRSSNPMLLTAPRQSLGSVGPPSAVQQTQPPQQQRLISSAPRPSTAPRSSVPMRMRPGNIPVEDDDSTPIIPGTAIPGTSNKGKKHCAACNRTVSLNHGAWIKHINSKKHAEQVKGAGGVGIGGSPATNQPLFANKGPHLPNGYPTPSSTAMAGSNSSIAANNAGAHPPGPKMPRGYALISYSDEEDSDLVHHRNHNPATLHHRRHTYPHGTHGLESDTDVTSGLSTPDRNAGGAPLNAAATVPDAGAEPPRRRRRKRRSGETKGETQWCADCQCQISVKNWNIHTRSNKHRMNSNADELRAEGGEPAAKKARIEG